MPNEQDGQLPLSGSARIGLSAELKEILEFAERENQKHREYFQMLYTRTAGFLTVIVVVIGGLVAFVGWHTIDDIRKQAEAATQEEIRNTRKQSEETLRLQTTEIQSQITKKLEDEFKTDAIKQTVQLAAKQQTSGALLPIINTEVRSQVTSGVKSEQQTVQRAMLEEVHKSVEELKPTINKRVDESVSKSVESAVHFQVDSQIAPRLRDLENNAQISSLINQAEGGDGTAFDTLFRMSGDAQITPATRDLALKVARSVVAIHNVSFPPKRNFIDPKTEDQEIAFLNNSDASIRHAAVDSLTAGYWKLHMDQLFGIMTSDSALDVREAAYIQFKIITSMKADNLDNYSAIQWWQVHRKEFVK
jgi:predicted Holliday junction resolvase-like endonuclease